MPLRGAIFDLDGVLVNTVPLHFKAWKRMFGEYGKDFSFKDYEDEVDGIPRINGVRAILKDLSDEELTKAANKKQEYFLEILKEEGIEVFQDTLNLIKSIKDNKIKSAIISSSKNCLDILKKAGLDKLFDVIITGYDIKKGKPDPEIFILAANRLGLKPYECVVFEDAVLGVKAAKNGGFKCIGIDRYGDPGRLSKADLVVSTFNEVTVEKLRDIVK